MGDAPRAVRAVPWHGSLSSSLLLPPFGAATTWIEGAPSVRIRESCATQCCSAPASVASSSSSTASGQHPSDLVQFRLASVLTSHPVSDPRHERG